MKLVTPRQNPHNRLCTHSAQQRFKSASIRFWSVYTVCMKKQWVFSYPYETSIYIRFQHQFQTLAALQRLGNSQLTIARIASYSLYTDWHTVVVIMATRHLHRDARKDNKSFSFYYNFMKLADFLKNVSSSVGSFQLMHYRERSKSV